MGSSNATAIRVLRGGDEVALERFLSGHRDSSMCYESVGFRRVGDYGLVLLK